MSMGFLTVESCSLVRAKVHRSDKYESCSNIQTSKTKTKKVRANKVFNTGSDSHRLPRMSPDPCFGLKPRVA